MAAEQGTTPSEHEGASAPTPSTPASATAPTAPANATPAAASGSVGARPARLAVFDYDGTSINGQSGGLFSVYLFRHGLLPLHTAVRLGWWGARYLFHLPHRQDEARELVFARLGQLDPDRVVAIMNDFHDEYLIPRYRDAALAEVRRRHDEGCVTLLVSATFWSIARMAAEHMGMDGFVATKMTTDATGHYNGDVEGEVIQGPEKIRAVRAWADERFGTGGWTIAYAYGDHHSDEELLSAAGEAFAVCPGQTLERIAKRQGWKILDWQ
ncbi:MAG: haloacid dehalogenase-like hydrolase [Atopobiaceae bacterium]|nr:haloacid dehalogenase-like hydrolase [Atopobiaceae bacterium]